MLSADALPYPPPLPLPLHIALVIPFECSVCGELAVSRSIGDRDFKGFTKRRIEEGTEGVAPLEVSVITWLW